MQYVYSHIRGKSIGVGFCIARSQVYGLWKASVSGNEQVSFPRLFILNVYTKSGETIGKNTLSPMCNICQVIEGLGIQEDIIKEHLQILFNSIVNVKKENLWFSIYDQKIQQVERTFTYELYRLWKNNIQTLDGNKEYTQFSIDAETSKILTTNLKNAFLRGGSVPARYPDFVLHKGQGIFESTSQLMICEVKRSRNPRHGFKKDFETFSLLMDKNVFEHPFAYAVHITLGSNLSLIAKKIKTYKDLFRSGDYSHVMLNADIDILDRIICVSYNPDDSLQMEAITMKQLIG